METNEMEIDVKVWSGIKSKKCTLSSDDDETTKQKTNKKKVNCENK